MLEICLQNVDDIEILNRYRDIVDRIELVTAIEIGGLSPSIEILKRVKESTDIPVMSMLRCRAGDFYYTEQEHKLHLDCLKNLLNYTDGIVFGSLTKENKINVEQTKEVLDLTIKAGKEFVFHRAIDCTENYEESVKLLDELGVTRILTSGHEENAEKGLNNIKNLKTNCEILAGSGINENNFRKFFPLQIHGTFSKKINSSFGFYLKLDEEKLKKV
ncbi:MAG: copper homeostasis protein CutC, partial [Fusobacterium sp.]|uniref:copper homeostasis protein CutC n=1 Tax=Fusobacterium sp. TaxID=68766 RepID=UPI0026DD7143